MNEKRAGKRSRSLSSANSNWLIESNKNHVPIPQKVKQVVFLEQNTKKSKRSKSNGLY